MSSEYLTNKTDLTIDGQLVYPAGTLLRVTGREGDQVRVSGNVNGERRKRWLHKSLVCDLPTAPDGEFWRTIFPHAPADRAQLYRPVGKTGLLLVYSGDAERLVEWVQAHPTHADSANGMHISEQGYTLMLRYLKNELKRSGWLYFFDFNLKAMGEAKETTHD
jgi:hypothetical protein